MNIWTLTILDPADNVAAGDYNEMRVAAETAEDAQQWAWREAVRAGNHNEGIWLNAHESILRILHFDQIDEDAAGGVIETSRWVVECKFCETELHNEDGLWVDATNGDEGGTYDRCTVNTGDPSMHPSAGHRPAPGKVA